MKMIHSDATAWQHWQLTRDGEGLAWLSLDKAGESTNSLSAAVLAELSGVLDELERHPPRGLILRSAKAAGFIAGADIGEFDALADIAAARAMVTRGWALCNRLAAVPYPTLALVRGHCLGGGLELALACRTLVVVDGPGTKLGLPEVMTGWSSVPELRIKFSNGAPDKYSTYKWKDSWRVALGANYTLSERTKLKFGVAVDKTPLDGSTYRTPRLPDEDRLWLSLGLQYKLMPGHTIDVGYAYLNAKDAKIHDSGTPADAMKNGVLDGTYKSHVQILGVQYSMQF